MCGNARFIFAAPVGSLEQKQPLCHTGAASISTAVKIVGGQRRAEVIGTAGGSTPRLSMEVSSARDKHDVTLLQNISDSYFGYNNIIITADAREEQNQALLSEGRQCKPSRRNSSHAAFDWCIQPILLKDIYSLT